ncbi:transporter substrate-binding domain-containing protein [Fredinandcohnia sp. FSL W7-1320]|uniref:transporter substrate-binding domain-containing protein n=1 Tax=Fredinandcohnia sp. FSL W7-1320 TaxID=2954540 RepID=UPI0030FDDE1F
MVKRTKLLIFLGLILLLAACSGEASSVKSETGVRTIEVAVPPTSKPLSWEENGKLVGYEPEILKLVDEKLADYEFNLVGVADSAAEIGLDTGKYDMIAQGLFKSAEREEKYLLPSENNGASLMKIYTNNKNIKDMKDLVGKKIVPTTPTGGVFNFLMAWNEENPEYKIEFKTSDAGLSYADRLKEVDSGKYDALILPSNLGQSKIIENENLNIHVTDPVKVFPTYFLIYRTEENKKLAEEVGIALKELKEEGKLPELSIKYYDEDVFIHE